MLAYEMESSDVSDVRIKTDAAFPPALGGLFVVVYVQGYLERIGVPPHVVKILVEAPVLAIFLHVVNRGVRQCAPGFLLIAAYVVWTIASAIYHGDGMVATCLYVRYVVYAYLVFVAVWTTPLTHTSVRCINAVIVTLFVFQIVASAHEVFVRGERVEAHVGALFTSGGALATEFPLFAMALTVSFYLFWRGNPLLLVLAWAFFLVGYASGKRAIYFLGPVLYAGILVWYVLRTRTLGALKRFAGGILVFLCLAPLLLLGFSMSHGISHRQWNRPLERVSYALDAAARYNAAYDRAGRTIGRTATSRHVLATLWSEDKETVLFGWGPRAVRIGEERRYEKLTITYGICGWAQDVICLGWPGMLIYLLFQLRMFSYLWFCPSPRYDGYWMAVRFGVEVGFVVIMLSYIAYSSSVITGGHLSYVYFYLLALLTSPVHRSLLRNASQNEAGTAKPCPLVGEETTL